MTVSVHQPNFVPYIGFFEKMKQSDVFVIMGYCQFEKGKYQNRFYTGSNWHTMSVNSGLIPIIKKRYINPLKDWEKITTKFNKLQEFNDLISHDLWRTNTAIIVRAANMLGIKTKIVFDYPTDLKATDRLVDLCRHYGATKYLSGISGKNYLDRALFAEYKIDLEFQDETTIDKRSLVECI